MALRRTGIPNPNCISVCLAGNGRSLIAAAEHTIFIIEVVTGKVFDHESPLIHESSLLPQKVRFDKAAAGSHGLRHGVSR